MDAEEILKIYRMGFGNLRENELRKASRILEKVWEIEGNEKLRIFTGINLSLCYFKLNNPMKALDVLGELVENVDEAFVKASVLFNTAAIKCSLGFLEEALGIDLKIVKILKGVEDGLNCFTLKVSVYRNIAVICKQLGQLEQASKYDYQARNLAMKFLGPSNLLTISLERNRIFYSSEQFKPSPLPSKSFLKALRFVSGERLQPMHNKRTAWTKRLKSLCGCTETFQKDPIIRPEYLTPNITNTKFSRISGLVENIKNVILEKRNDSQKNWEKIEEKSGTKGLVTKTHKKIKIVSLKEIELNKKKIRAAILIQKWFRGYNCRRLLFLREVQDRVDLRIECLDMFKDENSLFEKKSEQYEEIINNNDIYDKEYSENFEENEESYKNLEIIKEVHSVNQLEKPKDIIKNPQEVQERSAKIIQFHFRNHLSKLAIGFPLPEIINNTLYIQKIFRLYLKRKNQSAVKIQKTFKMFKFRSYFKVARSAIILIQKWYRLQKMNPI